MTTQLQKCREVAAALDEECTEWRRRDAEWREHRHAAEKALSDMPIVVDNYRNARARAEAAEAERDDANTVAALNQSRVEEMAAQLAAAEARAAELTAQLAAMEHAACPHCGAPLTGQEPGGTGNVRVAIFGAREYGWPAPAVAWQEATEDERAEGAADLLIVAREAAGD